MPKVIVLDTHAWIWWLSNPEQLSEKARDAIRQAAGRAALYISSISAWEVAMLTGKGRMELTMDAGEWIAASEALTFIHFVPVNNHIAIKAVKLPQPFHSDPADRIIIATALTLGATIVTMDRKIHDYPHVKTLW